MTKATKQKNAKVDLSDDGIKAAIAAVESIDTSRDPIAKAIGKALKASAINEATILAFDPPAYPAAAVAQATDAARLFFNSFKVLGYKLNILEGDEENRIATISLVYTEKNNAE